MYRNWKSTINNEEYEYKTVNFEIHDRIVSDGIQNAKHQYYFNTFVSHKIDMKKTLKTIDENLNRGHKKNNFPIEFIVDHKLISDHKEIAHNFNVLFANIGAKLTAGNNQSNNYYCAQSYSDYLNNSTPHRFAILAINEYYILSIINKLKKKKFLEIMRYQTNYLKLLEINYLNH